MENQAQTKQLLPPAVIDVKQQHDIRIEDLKLEAEIQDRAWQSCCFSLHRESTLFFGKLSVSFAVISLCSYQLIKNTDPSSQSLYSSILSSVVTFWLSKGTSK